MLLFLLAAKHQAGMLCLHGGGTTSQVDYALEIGPLVAKVQKMELATVGWAKTDS